jgi:hypothetical protein
MKTPYALVLALMFMASCEADEKPFTGIRAKIAGNEWVADEVIVETPASDPSRISRIRAIDDRNFQMIFSFDKLGITFSNTSVQFRARTADLNYFNFSIASDNEVIVKWQTQSEINLSRFEVEWSFDKFDWDYYTTVFANGNTSSPTNYQVNVPINIADDVVMYFRLAIYDVDWSVVYTDPITVTLSYPVSVRTTAFGSKLECYDGTLTLTKYDPLKKKLSGTFQFKYKSEFGSEVVVTDGEMSNLAY